MFVVLSLGGSLVNTENGFDKAYVEGIKEMVLASGHRFGIVVGGGREARKKAEKVRKKGGNEFEADEKAIKVTRKNAKMIAEVFGGIANQKIPKYFDQVKMEDGQNVIVMGGTIPGITTDTDAVLLAEKLHASRLVNISNVDAIYDSNPKDNPNAKRFSEMGYEELIGLAVRSDQRKAGTNFVFDLLACKLIARSKIEAHFVSGKNMDDLKKAIEGKPHSGTVVR